MSRACEAALAVPVSSPGRPVERRVDDERPDALAGWLSYLTVTLVWGSTYLAIAVALESFTTYGMIAARFSVASLLVLGLGRLRGEPLPRRRDVPHLMLVGALLLGISNALVVWSETRVASGVAAVLCSLTPAWMGLLTLRTEPLGARGWIGAGAGLLGVVVLLAPWSAGGLDIPGALAILVATAVWAYGTLHGRTHVTSGGTFTNSGVQMATAALIGLLVAPATGGFLRGTPSPKALLAVSYLALFGSCLAYTAHNYLARAWNPVRAGTYAYLNPVIAVLLGALLLSEPIGLRTLAGTAVILAGVALVQLRAPRG